MRVLVACECSGVVRDAFRKLGHDAWSCDLKESDSDREHHIRNDVLAYIYKPDVASWKCSKCGVWSYGDNCKACGGITVSCDWDLLIAHPPCTDLSVSGALHFAAKRADGRQQKAINFFMAMADAPVPRICIENPVGIMSTVWRKPNQYVQPYQFGDDASKNTGLWLKGLPKLVADPAKYIKPRMVCKCGEVYPYDQEFGRGCPKCGPGNAKPRWANQCNSGQNKLGPSPERAALRAKTYPGIAAAMAEQWGVT